MIPQRVRLTRQICENTLGDLLSELMIASDLTQRGRIDQIEMPLHQFGKVLLSPGESEPLQQCGVV